MAAIARIAVISAVFYLVRFALAHQHHTRSKYSDSDSTNSLQEDNISGYEESSEKEKVLIRSGVPLRGRTIHQTAWSEEERVSVSGKDILQQPGDQNSKEKLYNSWSLTNAINYVLSFIYGTETDGITIISNNLAENSNENLSIPKTNLDESTNLQTSKKIKDPKEKLEDNPVFKKQIVSETSSNNPIANLQNQYVEWFKNEISSLSNEYIDIESDSKSSEFSNEITDFEYDEYSYEHEEYDMINKEKVNEMYDSGSLINDSKEDSIKNNTIKPLTEIRDGEPEFVFVAKSHVSDPESDNNNRKKYQEDDIHPAGNTKLKNILPSTNLHPKQQSKIETMKEFMETESYSQRTKSPSESFSSEDIFTEKSIKEYIMQGYVNYDENEDENVYETTERTLLIEIPSTASHLHNQEQSQNKRQSSKSDFSTQTEKPKVVIDGKKQGKVQEDNRLFVNTTENFNEQQDEKKVKNPNYVKKTTVLFSDHAQTSTRFKISSNYNKKDIDNKISSNLQNKSVVTHTKPSQFPSVKPLKGRDQKHLKSKQKYSNDIYFDLEPDEDIRSYNYLLDSYEFIRTGNNNNKVDKKHDSSIYVIIQDKERNSEKETSTILSEPLTPFTDQKEVEVIDKSHESFNTILEYLYKNSNSSFILSLKGYNSSEI